MKIFWIPFIIAIIILGVMGWLTYKQYVISEEPNYKYTVCSGFICWDSNVAIRRDNKVILDNGECYGNCIIKEYDN